MFPALGGFAAGPLAPLAFPTLGAVPALERYDEWEASLEAVYPPEVLAAIDARREPTAPARFARRTAGAALVLGLVNGVREAFDPDDGEAEVEIDDVMRRSRHEPVSVYLAWGDPAASVAVVRPWLMAR